MHLKHPYLSLKSGKKSRNYLPNARSGNSFHDEIWSKTFPESRNYLPNTRSGDVPTLIQTGDVKDSQLK